MRKYLYIYGLAILGLAAPTAGMASDITYTVDEGVGPGSVTGTITTDGTIGTLATGDIVNWDLTLKDGSGGMFLLDLGDSQEIDEGDDVTATSTGLLYNYSDADMGLLLFEAPTVGSDDQFLCYTSSPDCSSDDLASVSLSTEDGEALTVDTPMTGTRAIGAVTPEPSSLLLLGSGMVGLFFVARRRLRAGTPQE